MEASEFVEDEMKKVQSDLAELDARIAAFKERHINELPSLLQANLQGLHTIESNMERLKEQLRGLKERKGYLEAQLAAVPPKLEQERKKRLEELKLELAYLRSRFSDEYPDVIKAKAEIAEIEGKLTNPNELSVTNDNLPDNPAYITLASQLASVQTDIDSVARQIEDMNVKADEYRRRIG
jgi:chromosome segregation ATPase